MKNLDRRDFFVALSAFAAIGSVAAEAQAVAGSGEKTLSQSRTFPFKELPVKPSANGGAGRAVVQGVLATGEAVEVHETTLPPGKMPHPPHKHRNTEFVLIREGKLEFLNDGTPEPAGVGDVIYTASNQMHGMKNVGDTAALYFVVSVSHGQM